MASLPRPSRPSMNPPTSPLPSIPVSKNRKASAAPSEPSANASSSPVSALPPPPASRTASSSSIPTVNNGNAPSVTPPASNTPKPSLALLPDRSVRKTSSYGNLPKPLAGAAAQRSPSINSTASSRSTTPRSSARASSLFNGVVPQRSSSTATSVRTSIATAGNTVPVEKKDVKSARASTVVLAGESAVDDADGPAAEEQRRGRPASTTKEKGNVIISVRVRPEASSNDRDTAAGEWMVDGRQALVSYQGREGGEYFYDNVFTTHDKNAKVYDAAAKRLVRRVMEGYHGTVFAYGMTGTGKTFSMQGTATSPGVIPLAITDIFSFIRETPHREFLLRVSYLEIYNEKIHDLLATPLGPGQGIQQQDEIKLREDSKRGVYATPLKEEIVQSPTQLLRVIARGDHARRTSSTQYNAHSSRSHAVVQIVVESRERNAAPASGADKRTPLIPGGVRVSTLSLIDLAGSERAAENKERQKEGAHINKSLLTLGTVIQRLSGKRDKSGNPTDNEGKHLPYRDSKLTRLLQSALSGNSLISILCTIQLGSIGSAAVAGNHTGETLNTLKFAARARNNIVSHAKKAEEAYGNMGDAGSRALLDRYRVEILELRKQLENQKVEKEKAKEEEEEKAKEQEQEARHEEQMLEMQLARTALKERIEHLNRLILSSKSVGVNVGRSYSSLSLNTQKRGSAVSNADTTTKSVRSSASTHTLDAQTQEAGRRTSSNSMLQMAHHQSMNSLNSDYQPPQYEDEEDTMGENGDGIASMAVQVRNLQADLADKNRYISTLEKRLMQARRNSRSRVSMTLNRYPPPLEDESRMQVLLREKDSEIAELRERLDDKDRMVAALRSAARKRDVAESPAPSTTPVPSDAANDESVDKGQRRTSSGSYRSVGVNHPKRYSINSVNNSINGSVAHHPHRTPSSSSSMSVRDIRAVSPVSPVAKLMNLNGISAGTLPGRDAATSPTRGHFRRGPSNGVNEMTRMLDEMIQQRVQSEGGGSKRSSLVGSRVGGRSSALARYNMDGANGAGWDASSTNQRRASMLGSSPSSDASAHVNGTSVGPGSSKPSAATATSAKARRRSSDATPAPPTHSSAATSVKRNSGSGSSRHRASTSVEEVQMQNSTFAALQATAALRPGWRDTSSNGTGKAALAATQTPPSEESDGPAPRAAVASRNPVSDTMLSGEEGDVDESEDDGTVVVGNGSAAPSPQRNRAVEVQ